jgi:hypothetical protein
MDWTKLAPAIATVLAALIAAYIGSWQGAKVALSRFRHERAFDRRLAWYETVARTLAETKLSIEIARTFEEDPSEPLEAKEREWGRVQGDYLELVRAEALSHLYAPQDVIDRLQATREQFDEVSDQSNGFDVHELGKHIDALETLIEAIDATRLVHAAAVRRDLGFDALRSSDMASG